MTTYTASARVDGGVLHTSRPLTGPEKVLDLVDTLLYEVQHGDGTVVAFEIAIEAAAEQTPIGDSVQASEMLPLEPEPDPSTTAYPPPLGSSATVDADNGSAVTR